MILGVPKESLSDEKRVALVPGDLASLVSKGYQIHIEKSAGKSAGFLDTEYEKKGAEIVSNRKKLFESVDGILQVMSGSANVNAGEQDLNQMKKGQFLIGFLEPYANRSILEKLAQKNISSFAMELIPRITRAQNMDALSSMANLAGYKSVLLASSAFSRILPMMTTAAGTMIPARVLVIGAGVAGLQAIATARRMGAIVSAYDVRPSVKEQVQSLGAKFVEMELETEDSEEKSGYAKEMSPEFYQKQQEFMTEILANSDIVITTAAIPGKKAPILITQNMVKKMKVGSLILDLAAERGGNCELTQIGKNIDHEGILILGPVNIPSSIPQHASQMYSRNMINFIQSVLPLSKEAESTEPTTKTINSINLEDEIVRATLLTHQGKIVHAQVREILGIP